MTGGIHTRSEFRSIGVAFREPGDFVGWGRFFCPRGPRRMNKACVSIKY